ncbi:glycosyltransferase family 2 protein [Patescibacteria group bacterium]|nr:glycosyltransferase family 2 protein [Patescibacteria group bacterium]
MRKNPRVGIVITSYQRLEYLKEAVSSAINQTYSNLEIVVSDDRSPDPAIRGYLETLKQPNVRWFINKANLGTTKNYDMGVRRLSDDVTWCVILDNDDYLDKNFITKAVKTHQKHPQSKVIHGRQIFIDAKGIVLTQDKDYPTLESAEDYMILRCLNHREIRTSSIVFNLNQFNKVGGYPVFPTGLGTDSVLIFALAFDNILAFSPNARVYTRLHSEAESGSTENLIGRLLSARKMREYCRRVYEHHPQHDQTRKKQVLRYVNFYTTVLSLFVLIGRCKELIQEKSKRSTDTALKKLIETCNKHGLTMEARFLKAAKLLNYTGVYVLSGALHTIESLGGIMRSLVFKKHGLTKWVKRA